MTTPAQAYRRAVLLMLGVALSFALLDALSKHLSRYYPVNQLVWARYTFHMLGMLIMLGPVWGRRLVATQRPRLQILRAILLLGATVCSFFALKYLPLAEVTAINFLAPLIVTVLSGRLLGEHVGREYWWALAAGFVGVLLIVRPGGAVFTWAALLPVGVAVNYALFQILTRKFSGQEHPFTTHFLTAVVGAGLASFTLPFAWSPIDWAGFVMMAGLGLFGGGGHYLLIRAFDLAPPARLAPFSYAQLAWATVISWIAFAHVPDAWALTGIAIIAAAGLYTALHARTLWRADTEITPE